jgi:hypothetical protein
MGKLYELVRKNVEELKQFEALQQTDFLASRKYDAVLKAYNNTRVLKAMTTSIDFQGKKIFGNAKNYSDYLNDNIEKGLYFFPYYSLEIDKPIDDYEKILNKFEASLNEEQIEAICEQFEQTKEKLFAKETHIYEQKIKDIKEEINLFPDNLITENEKKEIIKSLDFASDILIKKNGEHYHDKVIDIASKGRDIEAKKYEGQFIEKNNVSLDNLSELDKEQGITHVSPDDDKRNQLLKTFLNKKVTLSNDFKQKMLSLDRLVKENNILNNVVYGESAFKEYGFIDWFNKARELKDELNNYISSNETDPNKRIESLKNVSRVSNELKNITEKYNNVLDYIKDNFDLNKASLPTNIYSGRNKNTNDDVNFYFPDLPLPFDGENAPYGSILNGYSQIKAICNKGNITLEEFLNDPVDSFLNICKNEVEGIDNKLILSKDDNSLGKRMAHILIQPEKAYATISGLVNSTKCFDIINKMTDLDENTYDNMILTTIASHYISPLDHSNELMFGSFDVGSKNLKNLFALGDNEDNLFALSTKYLDKDFNYTDINAKYNQKINSLRNADPNLECTRIINILSDYFIERKNMYDDMAVGEGLNDPFKSGSIFSAAKEYFQDYLYENNIDLNKIRNNEVKKRLIDFVKNPVAVFAKEFNSERDIFVAKHHEDFDEFNAHFASAWDVLHKKEASEFVANFTEINSQGHGYNKGKKIETILNDNKGGIWERFIARSTSDEYKSLVDAITEATDKDSVRFGDLGPVKFYAKKYLEYKLRNKTINDISTVGKKRVEFCKTILKAFDELDDKYEIKINEPLVDLKSPLVKNDEIKEEEFQNKIKEHIEEKEEDIIEIKEKEIIEEKENIIDIK